MTDMSIGPDDLDAIEARADAATPGPWVLAQVRKDEVMLTHGGYPDSGYGHWGYLRPYDAAFIAASRTDVPALCRALREARAERDAARAWRREAESHFPVPRFASKAEERRWLAQTGIDAARAEAARWKERAEAAEAELRKTTGFLADAEHDLELLEDDIEEHLPSYLLDDGTNEAANHRERIEYAGADIRELTAKLTKAITPEVHAEVCRERDGQDHDIRRLCASRVELTAQIAASQAAVAALREALEAARGPAREAECDDAHPGCRRCAVIDTIHAALATTPSAAGAELAALREVAATAPKCSLCYGKGTWRYDPGDCSPGKDVPCDQCAKYRAALAAVDALRKEGK